MKRVLFTSVLLLFLSSFTLPVGTIADGGAPSVNGSFQISLENGQSRDVKFDATQASDGSTTGEITFRDAGGVATDSKASKYIEVSEALPPFFAKAKCDCLVVQGIEAVLSGTVTESSREDFIGRRVLLVIQDGDSLTPALRDKLTFGFYRTTAKSWVATDAERPEEGPSPTWVATDSERPDDTGTIAQKSEEVTCGSFPISAHNFIGAKQGKGKIQITR
jgi:hypothetical protein